MNAAATTTFSWWPVITPIVSVVLSTIASIITAWYIARKNIKKQAFQDLLKRLDDLEEAAEGLLLAAGKSEEAATLFRAVTRLDARLGQRLTEFFRTYKSKARISVLEPVPPKVSRALNALRNLACADDLLAADRGALPANDPKFSELRTTVEAVRNAIREEASDMKADHLQA